MGLARTAAIDAAPTRTNDFLVLAKVRITFLVVVTAAVGYSLAPGPFDAAVFFALVVGTALVSAGASALNQVWERETDARMERTRNRPVPAGRITAADARNFGLALCGFGIALLAAANWLTAALGLLAAASYVLAYTPMKKRSSLCTIVGAIPGALPPMMGWAAGRGALDAGAWALFALMFLWQLPHFLAIGWIYRDDYARAGLPMLTVTDPDGTSTGRQMVLYSAALLPVTLFAGSLVLAGPAYLGSAVALGLLFLACALRFARAKSVSAARWLFLVSVLYLPVLLGMMVFDR
ncbi:MAG: heme o synthase [Acidobacteriota bacterium]|nr:heme o synthase [Acidobacteriota bacterium]